MTSLFVYNIWIMRQGRSNYSEEIEVVKPPLAKILRSILILGISITTLVLGAELMIDGAVSIARNWDVEERVIAFTIIAFGTSVPELATSMLALRKNELGLSLGNLIGSNIFNILGIIGITATLTSIKVSQPVFDFDFYWVALIPLTVFPFLILSQKIGRFLGALLLMSYFAYLYFVF